MVNYIAIALRGNEQGQFFEGDISTYEIGYLDGLRPLYGLAARRD